MRLTVTIRHVSPIIKLILFFLLKNPYSVAKKSLESLEILKALDALDALETLEG